MLRKAFAAAFALLPLAGSAVVAPAVVAPQYFAPSALAYPPTPPDAGEAKTMLDALTVQEEGPRTGYSRDKFPHWIDQGDSCNTRELVLKRDGEDVQTDSACKAVSGRWYSVYDAQWLDSASQIQIDHIIPLAESWDSGANTWTTDRRREFANDLTHSQLIAVSGTSNQEKSDQDPADWVPPNDSVRCVYAREWIWVKSVYGMTIDSAEKSALTSELGTC